MFIRLPKVGIYNCGRQIESEEVIQELTREIVLIGTATETFETVTEKETVEYETEIRTTQQNLRLINLKIKLKMVLLKRLTKSEN